MAKKNNSSEKSVNNQCNRLINNLYHLIAGLYCLVSKFPKNFIFVIFISAYTHRTHGGSCHPPALRPRTDGQWPGTAGDGPRPEYWVEALIASKMPDLHIEVEKILVCLIHSIHGCFIYCITICNHR